MIAGNEKILKDSEHCFLSKKRIFSILIIPLIFFTQILILNEKSILDETYWIQKLDYLKQDLKSKNLSFDISRHAPHPGTLPLMVALAFKPLGFSDTSALKSAELFLLTIFISILFLLAIYFFRSYLLALGSIIFFIFNTHAFSSNSTDIVSSALIVIIILSALIHFQKRKNTPVSVSIILGASLGLTAATRLHIAFVVGFLVFIPLFLLTSKKNVFLMLFMALLSFCLFSPYFWQNPFKYFYDTFQALPYGDSTIAQKGEYRIKLFDLFSEAPFAFMSAVTALFLLFLPKEKILCDKKYIFFILIIVAVVGLLIYCANIPTLRYLYPMIFLLEFFFIFFCANLLKIIFSKRNFFITKYAILISTFLMNIIPAIYLFIIWIYFGPIDFEIFVFAMQIQSLSIILLFFVLQFLQTNRLQKE